MKRLKSAERSGTSDLSAIEPTPDKSCFFFFLGFLSAWPWSLCSCSVWPCSAWPCSAWPCDASLQPSAHSCPCSAWPCSWWPCSCPCVVHASSVQLASVHSSASSKSYSLISSSKRSSEKELRPISLSIGTRDCWLSINSAKELIELIVSLTIASSSLVTRSVLLRMMRSEKATCCTASLTVSSARLSLRCVRMCLQSTRQSTPSMRKLFIKEKSEVMVLMTGAGSARPVVSSSTRSKFFLRSLSCPKALTKSPRTVQHAQPLSMVISSSAAFTFSLTRASSMLTAPNSFSITATRGGNRKVGT
mmetsp:Transcript_15838/g.33866  ORF Transcript_15838/g.33866 Transcript_15838/m.33866 type:complete len:304 (-) Transcript_15838:89-1000(-)